MEWKIYLRYQGKAYKILKLRQGANFDIIIIPNNAVFFSREIIKNLDFDTQIQIKYESLEGQINHFSAHAMTGQRHVKLNPSSLALEPTIGLGFENINKPIPLVTIIAATNQGCEEEPSSGKWFGFQLPDDVNYLIMELSAIPKNSRVEIQQSYSILNEKKTNETIDFIPIEMRNCIILAVIRTTNHELTDIPNNVVFQQVEGKSINIIRVEKGIVIAQVSRLAVG
ncbi:MAG: hypothetical protein A2W35_09515 [Chloroflexi bacterium RBG_16_57_11]|nr:MAG: hypothetical protein A2W35_09515 [Chloroflexi bacterium RBG_16_57_11]